jgi:hypothetical protein
MKEICSSHIVITFLETLFQIVAFFYVVRPNEHFVLYFLLLPFLEGIILEHRRKDNQSNVYVFTFKFQNLC